MSIRSIALALLALALATPPAPAARAAAGAVGQDAQQPQAPQEPDEDDPVQLGTELVTVPFNVTDKKNRHITDVRQQEVEVLEDGRPQEIFSFERQLEAPLTISLLIDTSGSQEATIGIEKEAAYRFFAKVLRPQKDLASVVSFAKEVTLEQSLTGSLPSLNTALDRVRVNPASGFGRGGTAPTNPLAGGTSMYDAVYLAADEILKREAGRRVIILLSDGVDTTSSLKSNDAVARALRSEVIVYAIGIGDPRMGGVSRGSLDKLAKETGGRTFEPRGVSDLDKAFAEIENDLRQQYIVSYTPSNTTRDGTFRKIEVKLPETGENRKDLRIRHRRGYYAPEA